jgi:uncharacterized protein DUF4349
MSSPELVANRLEELLAGAFPETQDEARLQGLARELRSATSAVPAALRERVAEIKPAPRVRATRRRLIVVVATFTLLAAAALGASAYFSGSGQRVVHGEGMLVHGASQQPRASYQPSRPYTQSSGLQGEPSLAPPAAVERARAQDVDMWIDLRVQDADHVSSASQDAVRITRDLGGVVKSSTVDTRGNQGRAQLALRIPIGNLDDAVFRLTQLGTVTAQRTNTQDLQAPLDRVSRRIAEFRSKIRIELARLASGQLTAAEELEARIHLENLRRNLDFAKQSRDSIVSKTSMADLTFRLATGATGAADKSESGIAGAVDKAADFLRGAGAIAVFLALVLSPLLVLAILAWLALRARSRRIEARLLDEPRPGTPTRAA